MAHINLLNQIENHHIDECTQTHTRKPLIRLRTNFKYFLFSNWLCQCVNPLSILWRISRRFYEKKKQLKFHLLFESLWVMILGIFCTCQKRRLPKMHNNHTHRIECIYKFCAEIWFFARNLYERCTTQNLLIECIMQAHFVYVI